MLSLLWTLAKSMCCVYPKLQLYNIPVIWLRWHSTYIYSRFRVRTTWSQQSIKGLITVGPGDHRRTPVQNKGTHANMHVRTRVFQHNACVRYGRQESALSGNWGGQTIAPRYVEAGGRPNPLHGLLGTALTFSTWLVAMWHKPHPQTNAALGW